MAKLSNRFTRKAGFEIRLQDIGKRLAGRESSQESLLVIYDQWISLFAPVHRGPVLRIKKLAVQRAVRAHLGILFRSQSFAIDHKDYFRCNPATTQSLVLVELRLLCLSAFLAGRSKHAH